MSADRLPRDELELASLACSLGVDKVPGLSIAESRLIDQSDGVSKAQTVRIRERIRAGEDPLGEAFCAIRGPLDRRPSGCVLSPPTIVSAMVGMALDRASPHRIVDPGAGSGRFLMEAGRHSKARRSQLLGVELDPLLALLTRANLQAAGLAERSRVVLGDYRDVVLEPAGSNLFVGNPPYVRHHHISASWKSWLAENCRNLDLPTNGLAGLHVYFYISTALQARDGDTGAFITSSEWLDVNYGAIVRRLLSGRLGLQKLTIIEPSAEPFPGTATTAAMTFFQVGSIPDNVAVARAKSITRRALEAKGRRVKRARLITEPRWTRLDLPPRKVPRGYIELGELCRVHRGQVTGANRIWIAGDHSRCLPRSVLYPSVTRARELIECDGALSRPAGLRDVIDIPVELDSLSETDRKAVLSFLEAARGLGAEGSYVARNRKRWWSVGLRVEAPILTTYMARRAPVFVRNLAGARHLNIAHGIYPRVELDANLLDNLARYMSQNVAQHDGRTYAGGLTKFEPKELERLLVPDLPLLSRPSVTV